MSQPGSNNILNRGQPLLALCPEHAALLASDGWTRDAHPRRGCSSTRATPPGKPLAGDAPRHRRTHGCPRARCPRAAQERFDDDVMLPIADAPEGIHIVVAGGAGKHSAWFPSWGRLSRAVSVPIVARR